jgi:hypothetical protein
MHLSQRHGSRRGVGTCNRLRHSQESHRSRGSLKHLARTRQVQGTFYFIQRQLPQDITCKQSHQFQMCFRSREIKRNFANET